MARNIGSWLGCLRGQKLGHRHKRFLCRSLLFFAHSFRHFSTGKMSPNYSGC